VRQDSRDSEIASGSTYSASPSIDSGCTITRSTRGISPVATFSSFRIARGSFPQSPVKRGLSAETRTAWVASLARFTPAKPRIADGEHHEAVQRKRDHVSSHRPHLRHKKRGRPRSRRDRFSREPYLSKRREAAAALAASATPRTGPFARASQCGSSALCRRAARMIGRTAMRVMDAKAGVGVPLRGSPSDQGCVRPTRRTRQTKARRRHPAAGVARDDDDDFDGDIMPVICPTCQI
jgi:hypothetical protein